MLIAFVPPWLSLLFSSFNKQFLYCPPATKCILFSREQSGVVGPSEYASQHTCKSAYTMASEGLLTFIENICSTTHTQKNYYNKKLSDKWASFPLRGQSASHFAYPLTSPSPFSSIKNKTY
jgi:hypothetical protein